MAIHFCSYSYTQLSEQCDNQVVGPWNQLPAHIVEAPSVNTFKNRYDKMKNGARLKLRFYARHLQVQVQVSGIDRLRFCRQMSGGLPALRSIL